MGATMGWAFSYQVFVDTALLAYLSGASVSQIASSLKQHEFAQAGALLKTAADKTARSEATNAEAYCRYACCRISFENRRINRQWQCRIEQFMS